MLKTHLFWSEWVEGHERLDTAVVCDSSFVYWTLETPDEKPATKIEWTIYDVTDGKKAGVNADVKNMKTENPASGNKHDHQYQFILPDEKDAPKKHQFFEYEIQAVLHRDRLLCDGDDDTDTMKTTVRVTRIYNDTLRRVVCVGDTLRFFYDSLYNQADLSKYEPGQMAATKFVGAKKGQGDKYLDKWKYQVEVGKYDTLSRHYLSQAGCDSTMTLVLFVCDTFQFFDTIHLCSNQDTLYHERTIRGSSYKTTDTVDIPVHFYAQTCECQLSEFADKFRDKNGNPFKGCDSIYHLHLFVHPSYTVHDTDTVCLNVDGKATHHWTYGPKSRTVTQDDLAWSDGFAALIGTFRDTIPTKTCAECKDGGCDSILVSM